MMSTNNQTIAAIATPTGRGGVGVVRVSGKDLQVLAAQLTGKSPESSIEPRRAILTNFLAANGSVIDRGIMLYFAAPHSYTGEDVLELQGHGGAAVMQALLARTLELGARLAEPGEFTQRAYLNNKIDLVQAESVADLIDAASTEAAKAAAQSLTGVFSGRVHALVDSLIELRMHVEACIDFPEEEIDPANLEAQQAKLQHSRGVLATLLSEAKQGAVLRDGLTVALIGRANVGKSSLLNRLAGDDLAIVTAIPGTTRDQIRATILLEGVPIHLVDTAGIRDTDDEVEQIGIERTWAAVEKAGAALLITEAGENVRALEAAILGRLPADLPVAWVYNKIDLFGMNAGTTTEDNHTALRISALTGEGVDELRTWLKQAAGWRQSDSGGGLFVARERHLVALRAAEQHLRIAGEHKTQFDLFAEELRLTQQQLSSITGEFTPDDLLGEIFSRFCIGK